MPKGRYTKTSKMSQNDAEIQEKFEKIKAEEERLRKQFGAIDKKKQNVLESTIKDAAFAGVELEYLKDSLVRDGTMIEYQNGENQWGTKQSPDAELYVKMSQRLNAAVKILLDCMPKERGGSQDDGFDEFVDDRE